MIKMLAAYGLTLVAFAAIDAVWLINMAPRLYKPEIGPVMMENGFRLVPAIVFYAIYLAGIVYFAVAWVIGGIGRPGLDCNRTAGLVSSVIGRWQLWQSKKKNSG